MTKRERVMATLRGEKTDRPPITAYRHFPKVEREPRDLANIMLKWQKDYDWDIVKVHPSAVYMQEAYGDKIDYVNYEQEIFPTKLSSAAKGYDLSVFKILDMTNQALKDHVEAIKLIRDGLDEDVPILQTVFTPLQIVSGVFDLPFVRRHFPADREENPIFKIMEEHEEELLKALDNITETYINYWKALKEVGCDGFFLAGISWARTDYMKFEEWEKFVKRFDVKFSQAVKNDGGIIMYHTCGIKSNPDRFKDFPIDILHWDQGAEDNPSIKEASAYLGKITPMGGVDEMIFGNNSEEEIARQAKKAIEENKDIPFILAPYCSVSIHSTDAEMRAFRDSVEK